MYFFFGNRINGIKILVKLKRCKINTFIKHDQNWKKIIIIDYANEQ